MKLVRNVTDFYLNNDKDISNFIKKFYPAVLDYYDIEDIKNEIYERLHRKQYIQKYAPLYIGIDTKNNSWEVKRAKAKFSTYIYTFVKNYVWSYYNKIKPDEMHISLDSFNDSYYDNSTNSKIRVLDETVAHFTPTIRSDLKMELLNKLEQLKKNDKGTFVLDRDIDLTIVKYIDSFGKEGCPENKLKDRLLNRNTELNNISGMEEFLLEKKLKELEKNNTIKIDYTFKENNKKERVYHINDPERRSMFNLLRYYLKGYRDKEISEKFKMTVAGVGAMKRSLRKELQHLK